MDATEASRRAARLACWSEAVEPVPLPGGISNINFRVRHRGRNYVVRIGADAPEHAVYRFNEQTVSEAAADAGLSPQVIYSTPDALVLDYIENGRPLARDDLHDPQMLTRVAELLRRCHTELPARLAVPGPAFQVFHANRRYGRQLGRIGHRLPDPMLQSLMRDNDALARRAAAYRPMFCHNDLMAGNLIDDGERLWLIDWEYGGWHDPVFDLANLAGNNELPASLEPMLLELYGVADARERYMVLKAGSLLREALWSLMAERTSAVQFDYRAYSDRYLELFQVCMRADVAALQM